MSNFNNQDSSNISQKNKLCPDSLRATNLRDTIFELVKSVNRVQNIINNRRTMFRSPPVTRKKSKASGIDIIPGPLRPIVQAAMRKNKTNAEPQTPTAPHSDDLSYLGAASRSRPDALNTFSIDENRDKDRLDLENPDEAEERSNLENITSIEKATNSNKGGAISELARLFSSNESLSRHIQDFRDDIAAKSAPPADILTPSGEKLPMSGLHSPFRNEDFRNSTHLSNLDQLGQILRLRRNSHASVHESDQGPHNPLPAGQLGPDSNPNTNQQRSNQAQSNPVRQGPMNSNQIGQNPTNPNQAQFNQIQSSVNQANQYPTNPTQTQFNPMQPSPINLNQANQVQSGQMYPNQVYPNQVHPNQMHPNQMYPNQMYSNQMQSGQMHGFNPMNMMNPYMNSFMPFVNPTRICQTHILCHIILVHHKIMPI